MKCDNDGAEMIITYTRDDGCRYFICPVCQQGIGEETEEWFKHQSLINQKSDKE